MQATRTAVVQEPLAAWPYSGKEGTMQYIYITDDFSVGAILAGEDPTFPDVPIEERFSADFLTKCVQVSDNVVVESHMKYNPESGTFYVPAPPPPPSVEEKPDQPIDPGAGETQKTYAEKLSALEAENKQLSSKLEASIKSSQMLEDCLVEMAGIVYA